MSPVQPEFPGLDGPTAEVHKTLSSLVAWGEDPTNGLLGMTLLLAVPLWVDRWRDRLASWTWPQVLARGRELSRVVAEKGDVMQFRGGKKGETAAAFNALAEGVALLSMFPGGVRFLGERWETRDGPTLLASLPYTGPHDSP